LHCLGAQPPRKKYTLFRWVGLQAEANFGLPENWSSSLRRDLEGAIYFILFVMAFVLELSMQWSLRLLSMISRLIYEVCLFFLPGYAIYGWLIVRSFYLKLERR
jgi:hypothetical protein